MLNRKWKEFYTYIRNSYEKKKPIINVDVPVQGTNITNAFIRFELGKFHRVEFWIV